MNVVDSSGWLSYLAGSDNAAAFARPIEDTHELIVPRITITEVFKYILRQRGEDMELEYIVYMEQGKVVPLDSTLSTIPFMIRREHGPKWLGMRASFG